MNIEQAKSIALIDILDKLGFKPVKTTGDQYKYFSPFRDEKTPSFHVHVKKNIWYDFGEVTGGNVIAFAREYLKHQEEGHTVPDILRWLKNMGGFMPFIRPVEIDEPQQPEPKLKVTQTTPIEDVGLIRYLESRAIPLDIASQILKEVRIFNRETKKSFHALCLRNEDRGYEIRNKYFKGCIGAKNITFIRGTQVKPPGLNIFEGFMDYLSIIVERNGEPFTDDTMILNTLSCLSKASGFIYKYGYETVYSWLDNDRAGEIALENLDAFLKTENNLTHKPMNEAYAPHKDVNAWLMKKMNLPVLA